MADGYGSAPKPTGKGVKPVPYEPKPGPWGIDTSWLDTPQQTPRLDGAATSLPAPPPLADMHGGGGNEVVNMTNMRAMMEALLAPVATSVLEVKAQVVQLEALVDDKPPAARRRLTERARGDIEYGGLVAELGGVRLGDVFLLGRADVDP